MFIDATARLAANQVHAAASTVAMTDHMTLTHPRDIGIGEPLALVVVCKSALGGTGGPTFAVDLQVDDNNAFSSATVIASSKAHVAAEVGIGAVIVVPIPPLTRLMSVSAFQAEFTYLRGRSTLTGSSPTMTFDAFIMPLSMVQNFRAHDDALTISA
jgi:hypothetical protein